MIVIVRFVIILLNAYLVSPQRSKSKTGLQPKQPNALRVNVKYITTFHQCIYYGSNKHFEYNYFIYAIYVPILYIL